MSVLGVLFLFAVSCLFLQAFCVFFEVVFLSFLIRGRLRPKLGKHQNYQKFLVVGSSRFIPPNLQGSHMRGYE